MSLVVRQVHSAAEAPSPLWGLAFGPPVEGRWWYETLEASGLEDQFKFSYLVAEKDGVPVGLAPIFLADVPIELVVPAELMPLFRLAARVLPGIMAQRTLFVGSPCSDEATLAFAPDTDPAETIIAFAKAQAELARAQGAWMLVWKDLAEGLRTLCQTPLRQAGFFPAVSYPGTEISFISADKEDYFRSLKPSHRQQLRKKLRRSFERAALEVSIVRAPDERVLGEIFGLFQQTFDQAETRFERLDIAFFRQIAERAPADFILLRQAEDQKLVAFMLVFDLGTTVINKFIGIDYGRPRDWMLYFRLNDAAVDYALAKGAKRLQSGQTGYRVKTELGHQLVPLTNFGRHRMPLVHLIYALVAKTISWASLDPELARFAAKP